MRKSFTSSKYTTSAFGKKAGGKEAGNIIVSPTFWNNSCLKIGGPWFKVL